MESMFKKLTCLTLVVFCSASILAQDNSESAGEGYGKKVLDLNKKIKDARESVAECDKSKGEKSDDCKKKREELAKLRAERETVVKAIPEGKGLRRKIRREMARDRIQERREKGEEPSSQDETDAKSEE